MSQKKYALIGRKLEHSFSKEYFSNKFERLGIGAKYENIELSKIEHVKDILQKKEYAGFNVTIPYKTQIIPYLDELDVSARVVDAVNTVLLDNNGKYIGYNTDVYGFKQMIKPFFKSHHERTLILGTGGASKAVAHVLEELGSDVIYVSRSPKGDNQFSYGDINENMIKFNKIVVNTTPVGMFPNEHEVINLPYTAFSEKHLAIDLIYNPEETLFLKKAKENGAWTLNGLTMLHQQAEKAWEIWTK